MIVLLFILRWSCSCLFQGNFAVVGVIWQGKLARSKGTFQKGLSVSRLNSEIFSILKQIQGFAGVLRVYFAVYVWNITQNQSLKAKKFMEEQSNHIVQISWNIWVKFDTFLPSVLVPMLIRVALKQKKRSDKNTPRQKVN